MIVPFDLIDFYFSSGITRPAGSLEKRILNANRIIINNNNLIVTSQHITHHVPNILLNRKFFPLRITYPVILSKATTIPKPNNNRLARPHHTKNHSIRPIGLIRDYVVCTIIKLSIIHPHKKRNRTTEIRNIHTNHPPTRDAAFAAIIPPATPKAMSPLLSRHPASRTSL
nr:MAG TPA: hypothetical protein [Caudoviricetes sp.]